MPVQVQVQEEDKDEERSSSPQQKPPSNHSRSLGGLFTSRHLEYRKELQRGGLVSLLTKEGWDLKLLLVL